MESEPELDVADDSVTPFPVVDEVLEDVEPVIDVIGEPAVSDNVDEIPQPNVESAEVVDTTEPENAVAADTDATEPITDHAIFTK